MAFTLLLAVSSCVLVVQCFSPDHQHRGHETLLAYHNEWAVKVAGSGEIAEIVAQQAGLHNAGSLKGMPHIYRLLKRDHPSTSAEAASHVTRLLAADPRVMWVEQQFSKDRTKRDLAEDYNDPKWQEEWYISRRTQQPGGAAPSGSMGVLEAMRQGLTGRGVSVVIVDDGLEFNNSDINAAYDPLFGYDVVGEDDDPRPRYDSLNSNEHGTKCAGIISMQPNNGVCGVGIAPGAKLGAVRLLDGVITDRTEGQAFGVFSRTADIISVSWGPTDSGRVADMPGRLLEEAIEDGITHGRQGRGVIFVWANGNGGSRGDNCAFDGYASSPYSLAVGSVDEGGRMPWYGEQCAATVAVTYAYSTTGSVVTTNLHDGCTAQFSGTSASAPMVAAIVALMLEANPSLSWRDVQHLFVYTSDPQPVLDNGHWTANAVGLRFNIKAGFGLVNAASLVHAARQWNTSLSAATPRRSCRTEADKRWTHLITGVKTSVTFQVSCRGESAVRHLEHVQLEVYLSYTRRGALHMNLTSPQGTTTPILLPRPRDGSTQGLRGFRLMSVGTWGEDSDGQWKLDIGDDTAEENFGEWSRLTLVLWGTEEKPHQLTSQTRLSTAQGGGSKVPSFRAQIPNNESVITENHIVPEANIHENIKPTHEPIDGVLMLDPDQDYSAEDSDLQENDFRQILDSLQGSQLTSNFRGRKHLFEEQHLGSVTNDEQANMRRAGRLWRLLP